MENIFAGESESEFESCCYSDKLISKLTLLNETATNKIDITEVKKAIYYARKYHGKQMRESGEPYYSHPLEVAYMISDYLFRTDIIVTSILHDTLEDTELTFEMIKSVFGEVVADQVIDLTRTKEGGRKVSSAELVESLWLQKKYEILFIKQFDRLHNIQTIQAKSKEKIKKILNETIDNFIVLAAYLEVRDIERKLIQLCINFIEHDSLNGDLDLLYKSDEQLLSL